MGWQWHQLDCMQVICSLLPSMLWCCWLGGRKGIRPVKNWVMGYWHGYVSGSRCRFAYGSADAAATHCLASVNSRLVLVPAHLYACIEYDFSQLLMLLKCRVIIFESHVIMVAFSKHICFIIITLGNIEYSRTCELLLKAVNKYKSLQFGVCLLWCFKLIILFSVCVFSVLTCV